MKKSSWQEYLSNIRVQEIELTFKGYNTKSFDKGLELGAGNGFQSELLIEYCNHLICTELNEDRLLQRDIPNIDYKICDAEKIDTYFPTEKLDLVFSSNMFEHLPSPDKALKGLTKILNDDGTVILILPSVFWKHCHMFLYYPVKVRDLLSKFLFKKKSVSQDQDSGPKEEGGQKVGNNIKLEEQEMGFIKKLIRWPKPHGVSKTHFGEYMKFRKASWKKVFEENGFDLVEVRRGPITSGYGLRYDTLRKIFWSLGFTSEFIYYLKKQNTNNTSN